MYNELKALLEAGYEVSFRPRKNGDVQLEVKEAKNGLVNGCGVDLNAMEWGWGAEGIADRLKEAFDMLTKPVKHTPKPAKKNSPHCQLEVEDFEGSLKWPKPAKKNCPHCQGMGWTPSTSSDGDPTDPCHACKGTGKA